MDFKPAGVEPLVGSGAPGCPRSGGEADAAGLGSTRRASELAAGGGSAPFTVATSLMSAANSGDVGNAKALALWRRLLAITLPIGEGDAENPPNWPDASCSSKRLVRSRAASACKEQYAANIKSVGVSGRGSVVKYTDGDDSMQPGWNALTHLPWLHCTQAPTSTPESWHTSHINLKR